MKRIYFNPSEHSKFRSVLKKRVNEYFTINGISPYATTGMKLKVLFFFILSVSLYILILFSRFPPFILLLIAIAFGVSLVLFALNVAHDASHDAFSVNPKVNRFLSWSWNLVGLSGYAWNLKHNYAHHGFPNVADHDTDIEQGFFLRYNPTMKHRKLHHVQHLYLPFLYSLTVLFLIFIKDFQFYKMHRFGNKTIEKHPISEYVILILTKLFYLTYAIIIPAIVLDIPFWQIIIGFLAMIMTAGLLISLILTPPHVTRGSYFTKSNESGMVSFDWATHQIETCLDFGANNIFFSGLFGGQPCHSIHHLFPKIAHAHYPALTRILRETAVEFGVQYRNRSWGKAIREHFAYIRELGNPDLIKIPTDFRISL